MPRVKIEQLREGMTVAEDVKNIDNMLLIPEGASLTERQIDILQAWGIAEVDVKAEEGVPGSSDPLAELSPEVLARLTAEVRAVFRDLDETDPAAMEIFKVMLQRRARKHGAPRA